MEMHRNPKNTNYQKLNKILEKHQIFHCRNTNSLKISHISIFHKTLEENKTFLNSIKYYWKTRRSKIHKTTAEDKTFQNHTKYQRKISPGKQVSKSQSSIIKSYKTRFKIVRIRQIKSQSQIEGQTVQFAKEKRQKRKAKQSKQWNTNIPEKTED
jgi:hypothetical protein